VPEAFGPNLRRARLKRGISLEELSTSTKVSVELWEAMERNDFSHWTKGLYARAYVRQYATLVGLNPDDAVDDFCRTIPQGDRRTEHLLRDHAELLGHRLAPTEDPLPSDARGDRRHSSPSEPKHLMFRLRSPRELRVVAAVVDASAVLLLASAAAIFVPGHFWQTFALIGLLYHGTSIAIAGCSPAVWTIFTYVSARPRRMLRPEGRTRLRFRGSVDQA
jgi:hypothetical protein